MRVLLKYINFWDNPQKAAVAGFLSVYIVWALPAVFWGWGQWVSYAYSFGDHIVLPLFNSFSFWLLTKRKGKVPLWSVALAVVASGFLITFFEPDVSAAREAGFVVWNIITYHGIFIFLEFAFILFMTAIYPFLRDVAYVPIKFIFILFLLVTAFLAFVIWPDGHLNNFPVWKNAAPLTLLWITFGVFVLDAKFNLVENNRIRLINSIKGKINQLRR